MGVLPDINGEAIVDIKRNISQLLIVILQIQMSEVFRNSFSKSAKGFIFEISGQQINLMLVKVRGEAVHFVKHQKGCQSRNLIPKASVTITVHKTRSILIELGSLESLSPVVQTENVENARGYE